MPNPKWEIPADRYGRLNPNMRGRGLALASVIQDIAKATNIDINELATLIQITAVTKDMFLKWSASRTDFAKGDDYDEYITAGQTVELAVPLKADGNFHEYLSVAGVASGGKVAVVEK